MPNLEFENSAFYFAGRLSDSKSILNRLLIIESYQNEWNLEIQSQADDVVDLYKSLKALKIGSKEFPIKAGGTTFRFLLGRLSRSPGEFKIFADFGLLSRPHKDLFDVLTQLNCQVEMIEGGIKVKSKGWANVDKVFVKSSLSSQFASSILLNSWSLEEDLEIEYGSDLVSESFLQLTVKCLEKSGMLIEKKLNGYKVLAAQKPNSQAPTSEVDANSLFTIACLALKYGELKVAPVQNNFGQPDFEFLKIFDQLKIKYSYGQGVFQIQKQKLSGNFSIDLSRAPDLFPVLSAFLSGVPGEHLIYGAPHLIFKESNRLNKTSELLKAMGVNHSLNVDGIKIQGGPWNFNQVPIVFDPANDHRMAFAAALFAFGGQKINLTDLRCVNKSFPEFWQILKLKSSDL